VAAVGALLLLGSTSEEINRRKEGKGKKRKGGRKIRRM
jgi:hypothetical protein